MPPSLHSLHPPKLHVSHRGIVKGDPIPGLMQNHPLLISDILEYAAQFHPNVEIISRLPEYSPQAISHRITYSQLEKRVKQLANALCKLNVSMSDRIGTISHNHHRHLEVYYSVSGIGAILHTINPRLFIEQIEYIINHAEDSLIFVDYACLTLLNELIKRNNIKCKKFILLVDENFMPHNSHAHHHHLFHHQPKILCYEKILLAELPTFDWPIFDENAASSLCYTSGTTGNPKGVLYTHRATVLHSVAGGLSDGINVNSNETILAVVPMFHVNAWGLPYTTLMFGAKLVLPGPFLDGPSLCRLFIEEKVTTSFGVPTVWLGLLKYLDDNPNIKIPVKRVIIGGSAPPRSMIERFHQKGITPLHAYGMTESSPLVTFCTELPEQMKWPLHKKIDLSMKQGRSGFLATIGLLNDDGKLIQTMDGTTRGDLVLKGNYITSAYYKLNSDGKDAASWNHQSNLTSDGWFKTGDVSTIDSDGFMQIVDRSKDIIKTGGEWMSSLEIESVAHSHPAVAEAAVIGLSHSKWSERPLLIIVKKPNTNVTESELISFMSSKLAKYAVPESVVFVNELPHTATGKLLKTALRDQFKDYKFPSDTNQKIIQAKL